MDKGLIFDIHRGTTHDGPGMRTTVFFKGCPLHCRWCQNPEGINPFRELQWDGKKCIGCMVCKDGCREGALSVGESGIRIDREKCVRCFSCAWSCPSKALHVVGEYWDVDSLTREACKDQLFFDEFQGGVTVSGGEPAMQGRFLIRFLKELKRRRVNTALDTSGFGSREIYEEVFPYVDTFLYDVKLIDDKLHRKYTGMSNEIILDNLRFLAKRIQSRGGASLWVRTPLIPGITATEENMAQIGSFIQNEIRPAVNRWELCAFNNICREKYRKIGELWEYERYELLKEDETAHLACYAEKYADVKVVVSGMTARNAVGGGRAEDGK